jgi:hypothetical protein
VDLPVDYYDPTPVPCFSTLGNGFCPGTIITHGSMKYFDLLKWSIFSPNDGFESGSYPCARGGGGEDNWCGSCIVFDMITNSTTITHLYANPDQAGPDICGCDTWLPLNSPLIDYNDTDISNKKLNDPNVNSNEILCTLAQVGNFWPTFIFGSENNILVEYEFNNIYRHNPFSGVSDVTLRVVDLSLPNSTMPLDFYDSKSNTFFIYLRLDEWTSFASWDLFEAGEYLMPCMRLSDGDIAKECSTCFALNITSGSTRFWHLFLDDGHDSWPPSTCGCSSWAPTPNMTSAIDTNVQKESTTLKSKAVSENATCAFVNSPKWWPTYTVGKPPLDGSRMHIVFGPDNGDVEPFNDSSPFAELILIDDDFSVQAPRLVQKDGDQVLTIQVFAPYKAWNDWVYEYVYQDGDLADFPCARMEATTSDFVCATCFVYTPLTNDTGTVQMWSQQWQMNLATPDLCGCSNWIPPR